MAFSYGEIKVNEISELSDDSQLVCYCEHVTIRDVKEAVKNGASSVDEVRRATGACKNGKRCRELNPQKRCCIPDIKSLVDKLSKRI